MPSAKKLTRRQSAVIEDLFTSGMDEHRALEKHNVSQALYNRWLADEHFAEQVQRRIAQAHHFGRIALARYASGAARKLIEMTHSKSEETARKACLNIISLDTASEGGKGKAEEDDTPGDSELPPEIASRILAALAGGDSEQENGNRRS